MASRFLLFLALLSLLATEEAVVLRLKKSLNSTSRLYWNDSDACKGKNVRDNRVLRIQIGRQNLGGFHPSNINELTSLQVFEVQDSQIGGLLPSLAGLNSLQSLNNTKFSAISWDFFNGTTSVQSVNLEHNPFTSLVIPKSFESVSTSQIFSVSDSNLTRVLPEILGLDRYPPVDVLTMPRRSLLSFNILMGTIPSPLLDVSDDNIDGEVPAFSNSVTVKKDGNVNVGTDRSDGSPTVAILGSLLVVLCVVIGVLVFFLCRAKVEPPSHVTNAGSSLDGESGPRKLQLVKDDCMVFSVQVLKIATDNFNEQNILGRGGFGSVYKGELNDGTKIAVKKMKPGLTSSKGLELFESEISAHTKVRHINLVKLLGYCINGSERHLVFELMTQGTLGRFLFNWKKEGLKPLEWRKRLGIALDVARAVEYLHSFAGKSFIHRDLKPSNILLGDDMRAKVADFGLVRHVPLDGEASTASKFVGTFGYIAPEYAETGRVSAKMDVYSFGVVLMELITGRKALDTSLPEEKQHIVAWFRSMLISKDTYAFPNAIDPNLDLSEEETLSNIITVAELADYCSSGESNQRPCMSHVVYVLSSLAGVWKPTKRADPQDSDGINHSMIFAEMIRDGRLLKECSLGNWNSVLGTNDDIEKILTN